LVEGNFRLWAIVDVLCAFISLYEPLFRAMSLRFGLWALIDFYVPLSDSMGNQLHSMCHRSIL